MAKFKVNQKVIRKSDGKVGVIKAREVISENKRTDVKYMVDFGDGLENWKVMRRGDLKNCQPEEKPNRSFIKTYDLGEGRILTMAAMTEICGIRDSYLFPKSKFLNIGYTIYNGIDEYDEKVGEKIAIHRCKYDPFTEMSSNFTSEFNRETVEAIMDVKADYISRNIEKFVS